MPRAVSRATGALIHCHMWNGTATLKKSFAISQEVNHPMWLSNPAPRYGRSERMTALFHIMCMMPLFEGPNGKQRVHPQASVYMSWQIFMVEDGWLAWAATGTALTTGRLREWGQVKKVHMAWLHWHKILEDANWSAETEGRRGHRGRECEGGL